MEFTKDFTRIPPGTDGGTNLHWAAGNKIVFLSYQDGWPDLERRHSIKVDIADGTMQVMTQGERNSNKDCPTNGG